MKSEFDPNKIEKAGSNKAKLFELSVNYVLNDAEILWQSSHLFLLGNSILAGFIGTTIIGGIARNWETFLLSSLGFLISVLWLLSYIRLSNYYKFRIDQAKQREPKGWMLFNEDGLHFALGEPIIIKGKRHSFDLGAFSNLLIVRVMAILFVLFYLWVSINSSPWQINISYIQK